MKIILFLIITLHTKVTLKSKSEFKKSRKLGLKEELEQLSNTDQESEVVQRNQEFIQGLKSKQDEVDRMKGDLARTKSQIQQLLDSALGKLENKILV